MLPIAGGRIIGFIPFPRVLLLCEMQSVSSRIWTRVTVSISSDDNHYTMGTFNYIFIILHIHQFSYTSNLVNLLSVWYHQLCSDPLKEVMKIQDYKKFYCVRRFLSKMNRPSKVKHNSSYYKLVMCYSVYKQTGQRKQQSFWEPKANDRHKDKFLTRIRTVEILSPIRHIFS